MCDSVIACWAFYPWLMAKGSCIYSNDANVMRLDGQTSDGKTEAAYDHPVHVSVFEAIVDHFQCPLELERLRFSPRIKIHLTRPTDSVYWTR